VRDHRTDAAWQQRELAYQESKRNYDSDHTKWYPANKKCLAVVKNTIEPSIMDSITDCATVSEYLSKIKNHWFFKDICYPSDQTFGVGEVHWRWH
jgi:hypothetical protein